MSVIAPGAHQFSEPQLRALELRLKQLDVERAEILQAIKDLKRAADREPEPTQVIEYVQLGRSLRDSAPVTPDEQIAVFLQLFPFLSRGCRPRRLPRLSLGGIHREPNA